MSEETLQHRVGVLEKNQGKILDKLDEQGKTILKHVTECTEQKKAELEARKLRDEAREKKESSRFWWVIGTLGPALGITGFDDVLMWLEKVFS